MRSLTDSILESMDGEDGALLPHLPYIMQDAWALGTDPQAVMKLIMANIHHTQRLSILDLGCGKGAVSVHLAVSLGCRCHGIDGIASFIDDALHYAKKYNVEEFCSFEVGDIRKIIIKLPSYDIIILGAIGPVFGDYTETLRKVKSHLNPGGSIIIDDAYLIENVLSQQGYKSKSQLHSQIQAVSMEIIDEHIFSKKKMQQSNAKMYQHIKFRCEELMVKYPNKEEIFKNYLKAQVEENQILVSDVINAIFLLQERKT